MGANAELLERVSGPIVLKNRTCCYCGRELSQEGVTWDTEHLIGRGFVPRGSLDNRWNLILRTCSACNRRKSDLEDDISAITLQPDALGRFPEATDPSVIEQAARKGSGSFSRITGKPVGASQERFTHKYVSDFMTLEVSYVGPPRIDEERIAALAFHHVVGLIYWLTYDEATATGNFIQGEFFPLRSALRSDWGNARHRAFMQKVAGWDNRVVGQTANGYFKVAIKRFRNLPCFSWAFEWNRNLRAIGFAGLSDIVSEVIAQLPSPEMHSLTATDGTITRTRREEALPDEEDVMFQMEE